MITGHIGAAAAVQCAGRSRASSAAFVALVLAAFAPDIVDTAYVLVGICSPYGLYSHTIHAVVLQSALVGGTVFLVSGSLRTALLFTIVVLLHVPADFVTGQKLLVPGGEFVGFRLYWRPVLDFLAEVPIILSGWWLLRRSMRGPQWAMSKGAVALLLVFQLAFDIFAAAVQSNLKPSGCVQAATSPVSATP